MKKKDQNKENKEREKEEIARDLWRTDTHPSWLMMMMNIELVVVIIIMEQWLIFRPKNQMQGI